MQQQYLLGADAMDPAYGVAKMPQQHDSVFTLATERTRHDMRAA